MYYLETLLYIELTIFGKVKGNEVVREREMLRVMVRYEVGFDPALAEIISEVKYMDQLGFDVPQDAKTIALLEDQYVLRVSALKQMLKQFYDVLDQLDVSQVTHTTNNY